VFSKALDFADLSGAFWPMLVGAGDHRHGHRAAQEAGALR
jgi:hypothetical protein